MKQSGYDRLARCYQLLETLAFGRALARARFRHAGRLRDCRRILLLGDGDGRGLQHICRVAPHARVDTIDSSLGMLERAARRLEPDDLKRVNFIHDDARAHSFPPAAYDAVTTLFFLDLFTENEARTLIARVRHALAPEALWLHVDFELPPGGWRRLRARVWLAAMQVFFRWQTDLGARALPPSPALLLEAGLRPEENVFTQGGFLRSAVYRLPAATAPAPLVST